MNLVWPWRLEDLATDSIIFFSKLLWVSTLFNIKFQNVTTPKTSDVRAGSMLDVARKWYILL